MGALANFPGLNPPASTTTETSKTPATTGTPSSGGIPMWVWIVVAMVVLGIVASVSAKSTGKK